MEKIMQENENYHIYYEMLRNALITDDVANGIHESLTILKDYINSGNIILYKKDEDKKYRVYATNNNKEIKTKTITSIINKTHKLVDLKQEVFIDAQLTKEFQNIYILKIRTDNKEYMLTINNISKEDINEEFISKIKETLEIILKRAEMYEKNTKSINIDLLTNLDNRNSYEKRINNIDETNPNLIVAVFDLFRLKYINDNYGHEIGDKYIKEAAKILEKYWPKTSIFTDENGEEKIKETGHCIYRTGGDEFVLLTTEDNIELVSLKAQLAAEEANYIDLIDNEDNITGLNVGIAQHIQNDFYKNTFETADKNMLEDKKNMYKKLGLDRRR